MDTIFRDRSSLYQRLTWEREPRRLCAELLAIFVLTAGLYGACMGAFRLLHPQYCYADFEISGQSTPAVRGRVAGISPEKRTVYVDRLKAPFSGEGQVRFNLSLPSEAIQVVSVGEEKDFGTIVLAPDTPLEEADAWKLPLWVALKTPLLFMLTLALCAPALYVLNLVFDIRLRFLPVIALMSLALAATGTMLAVFAPISGLFAVVTENYHFMKVFHVAIFAIAGMFGVKVLAEGLWQLAPEGAGARKLLCSWLLLYALVGGQLAWTLKPFLGTPYLPATPPFRVEGGNIYVSSFSSLGQLSK
jgi:hypothetical protein